MNNMQPLYVENKRGIPMCITLYKEWMIDRREMPNFQESFDAGLGSMKLVVRSVPDTVIIH